MGRRSFWLLGRMLGLVGWAIVPPAWAGGPADDLLRLVPADSGVTLVVEDLRDHYREIAGAPLLDGLKGLPSVRNYLASEGFRKIEGLSLELTTALGVTREKLRDDFLGDAVVLSLLPGPVDKPDESAGLLLVRPRDRSMTRTLLQVFNDAQTKSGELAAVEARSRGPIPYKIRKFKPGDRPPEFYAQFDDGTFAWSNDEAMILGVIDRKLAPGSGLGDDPAFGKVRRALASRPFVSVFVDPRLVARATSDPSRPAGEAPDWPAAMLARYLRAVRRLGVSLAWRDGFQLDTHEVLDPAKLDPWLRRWLTAAPSPVELPSKLPPSAIAVLSANLDFESLREAAWDLAPEEGRASLESLQLAFRGLLLGRDPAAEVFPRLGPGALLYLDVEPDPAAGRRFPIVGVVEWSSRPGDPDLAAPLDNALRTAFALLTLDTKRQEAHLRVESRNFGEVRLTSLVAGSKAWASYRTDRNRVVLGNSPEAVARFGSGRAPDLLSRLRGRDFPEAETFAIVDLGRLADELRAHRKSLARVLAARSSRPVEAADGDLGQLITAAGLLRAATFSSHSGRDATDVHRSLRLIAR